MLQRLFKFYALLSLCSCQYFQGPPPPRQVEDNLSQEYAQLRHSNISNVTYQLNVDLTEKESFKGQVVIDFNLKQPFYLSVDFSGGQVLALTVNEQLVDSPIYNGFFLEVPEEHLKVGSNNVVVKYSHPYSRDGTGLHRYTDPLDNRSYLYTNFEPYSANRFFPSFDQPDIKATYSAQVLTPKDWVVISSVRESTVEDKGAHKLWSFPQSARFSTYTYAVHAGPFKVWEPNETDAAVRIPLRLMARQSLAQYVDSDEWFALTRSGFKFFEKYFSSKYPYSKYDQLLVPEFNSGAMENVAAVTFNEERFISRGVKSQDKKRYLALTLYHEMAHMWFGNLVTMKWWDDLWLNESFATYSAYVGVSRLNQYENAWSTFNRYAKQSAYRLDKSTNTHPIASEVLSTNEAFSSFDAITYGKGASVLKQLSFYLGEKKYRQGLKQYFKQYAEKNTTLNDFVDAMEKASKKELQTWRQRWVDTELVNDMEVHFICRRGRIKSFEIYQTAPKEQPMLRTHKTKVALLRKSNGRFKIYRSKDVVYSGGRTLVSSMKGELCPDIVFPNYLDYDYSTVTLDKQSLKNIEMSLASVENKSLRAILWSNLWQMTLDQKLSVAQYLEIAEFNGINETEVDILSKVLENVSTTLSEYYPRDTDEWNNKRLVWVKFFEQAALTRLTTNETVAETQKTWLEFLTNTAESESVLQLLSALVSDKKSNLALQFTVDQDLRWAIVARLSQSAFAGADGLIERELKKDPSTRGQSQALFAQAVRPNLEHKQKILSNILSSRDSARLSEVKASLSGILPAGQGGFKESFSETYYRVLRSIREGSDRLFAGSFTEGLDPSECDLASYKKMDSFVKAEKGLPYGVVKRLKGLLFENDRCYKMQERVKKEPDVYYQRVR